MTHDDTAKLAVPTAARRAVVHLVTRASGPGARVPSNRAAPAARGAFTLVEVMIVVSIIVLMLALALPAFRTITGSRSVEGATNQVTALLGRARADAVGLQQPRGVAFYTDATGQCRMAEVGPVQFANWSNNQTPYARGTYATTTSQAIANGGAIITVPTYAVCIKDVPANTGTVANFPTATLVSQATSNQYWHVFTDNGTPPRSWPDPANLLSANYVNSDLYFAVNGIFYDVLADVDPIALPLGVGAQVITDSSTVTGTARRTDGYLRAGAIVFDRDGRVAYLRPGFVCASAGLIGSAVGLANTGVGNVNDIAFNNSNLPYPPQPVGQSPPSTYPLPQPLPSSFGLVLYDRDAFATQNFPTQNPTFTPGMNYGTVGSSPPTEADAEAWLDANATPLLLNRYNGTLVRGE